ncbi:MAG: carbohydrate binding family 9 domain-containing protein, partial [Gemmatimonadota bacterium]
MSILVRSCAPFWLLLLALAVPGSAQERSAQAVTVETPPVVDGVLDEAVWSEAPVVSGFIQRVPQDGSPATEATELRILQDDRAIYVGAWLFDSSPDGIIAGESVRDYNLEQSDAVLLILDTFRDQQNAFVFGTNPAGIEYDGQVANSGQGGGGFFGGGGGGNQRQQSGSGGGFNLNWDASWDVATSRDARGWYAEFRIPFTTLRYAAGEEQVWGLNVVRRVRRMNEQSFWSPVPREFDQYRLNYAGALEGLA